MDPSYSKSSSSSTRVINDDLIMADKAYVVFDWDNTLKLYNKETSQLSSRVSHDFLLHLKNKRHCQLYVISAIRPSALNLSTILFEMEKLGLTDVFGAATDFDQVDGTQSSQTVVKSEYARKGNVIICGYDKAETFLKLSGFDQDQGEKVFFFDDEVVNIDNFREMVPGSVCYLVE